MRQKLFIVGKETTIPLAASVYDLVLKDKNNYEPIILLITPLEEIISPKFIKKYLNARKYIPCWKSLKIILEENNSINQIQEIDPNIYKIILNELCSHPSQLFDLNGRAQYKNNSPDSIKFVLCSQALHLHNILKNNQESLIIDFDIYDISRTILLNVANFYGIEYRSVIRSRFENYYLKTNSLGKDLANKLFSLEIENKYITKAKNELTKFKLKKDITSAVEKTVLIPKFSFKASLSLIRLITLYSYLMLFRYSRGLIEFYKYPISNKHKRYILGSVFPSHLNTILKLIRNLLRIWQPYKKISLPNNYIYYPMPNTVENSETRFNGNFLSERLVIDLLRASLGLIPMICKDHRSMIKDRSSEFIKEVSKINNVIYLSEWSNKWDLVNPLRLLKNSTLNITISGTAGLESAILGKPTIILGEPVYAEYFRLAGLKFFNMREISQALKNEKFHKEKFIIEEKFIINYVASTIKLGMKIDLFFLIKDPFNPKFKDEIIKLINFLI